jgi:uncharacterized SAM-binding protein YcdF (DUF218 family)
MSEKENNRSCMGGCLRVVGSGIGLLVLIVVLIAGAYVLLRAAGAYLIYADELEPANAIVVLSGGTESRMNEALNLYKEDYGKVIVLTETGEQTEGYEYLNSFDMRIQLMNNGIPSGNIMITDLTVNTTVDEAVAIRDLMQKRQYSSAIVVTDPYHTRRSKLLFSQVFDGTDIRIIIRPVRSSWFNSRTWFTSVKGWQFTLLEYAKLISMKFGIAE